MTSTMEQFRHALQITGLLREEALVSLIEELPLEKRPQSPEALGEYLVNKQQLTAYQVKQILAEKADGLRLGHYVIQEVIRRGAMGVVYRARHVQMKRDVALKVILSSLADDPECVARFHREVHLAARLDHPNIVTAFDASEEEGQLFLVMEYIEGEDLKTIINKQGAFSVEEALGFIIQAARGLKYAHARGVIHRDVKPSNLLLSKSGTIKLLDVGLAMEECNRNDSDLTVAGGLLGSVNYMAPEQARDARDADARSDIYSLGCTLWYLLAGSFIYEEKTVVNRILAHRERPVPDLESLAENIPSELQSIFQKMVAKHPDDRYQSMEELLEDLETIQPHLSVPGQTSSEETCETVRSWNLHDTDHIRNASDQHLIELQDAPPEEYAPDDPTFHQETAPAGRLQTALIVIGGFSLGCLVMVMIHLIERGGLPHFRDLNTSKLQWLDEEQGARTENRSETPAAEEAANRSPGSATQSPGHSADSIQKEDGSPEPADAPFSPEQARVHQQRWADYLGTGVEQTNSLGMKMVLIPPGTYRMGSDGEDLRDLFNMFPDELLTLSKQFHREIPQHTVTLTRPYYMSAHLVTCAQFQRFVDDSGYRVQQVTEESWERLRSNHSSDRFNALPVRFICWNDAAAFCHWLSQQEERLYRLPTEAEWEYACRAGSQELFGHGFESLAEQEWWQENAGWPQPIGLKQANAFGIYDMRGNIREFCQDFYTRYSAPVQTDPLAEVSGPRDHRVIRGGAAGSRLYEIRPGRRGRIPASDLAVTYVSYRIVSPVMLPELGELQTGRLLTIAE